MQRESNLEPIDSDILTSASPKYCVLAESASSWVRNTRAERNLKERKTGPLSPFSVRPAAGRRSPSGSPLEHRRHDAPARGPIDSALRHAGPERAVARGAGS